jgi:hypothetical protein
LIKKNNKKINNNNNNQPTNQNYQAAGVRED